MSINVLTLTGATGYLGKAILPYLLDHYRPKSVRLFGRSEWKLTQILRAHNDTEQNVLRALVGDVRDKDRIFKAIKGSDLVIHAAAMKRLEICNYNPDEAIKTNVAGSMNVLDACLEHLPHKVIFVSSDKAVNPTNLYGRTKGVMESMVVNQANYLGKLSVPILNIVRYGNVIGSTGAVIPFFIDCAKNGYDLKITDPRMTRFLITRKMAWEIIKEAIESGKQGEIILPKKLMSINILKAAEYINNHFGNKSTIKEIGQWSGEKINEEIEVGVTSEHTNVDEKLFLELLREEGLI